MLKERGMSAVIFVIGSTVGAVGDDVQSRITYEQALEMSQNGIEIQSHTFNMHKAPLSETDPTRHGVGKLAHETDEAHLDALNEDFTFFVSTFKQKIGKDITALSYPYGIYNANSETASAKCGIKMTFTSDSGVSKIEKNNPNSLRLIKRIVIDDCTAQDLLIKITPQQ